MNHEKKFEEILDICIERLRNGESINEILQDYPHAQDQLRSHLEISRSLFQLKHPEVKAAAIHRTIFKMGSEAGPSRTVTPKPGKLKTVLAWAASIILVFIIGGYTTVNMADASIPGDFLYPVKLATERARLALVRSPQGEIEMHIILSENRLQEIIATTEKGHLHEAVLISMLDEAAKAIYNIEQLEGTERTVLMKKVKSLCAFQQEILENLVATVPPDDHKQLQQAITICGERWKRCREMNGNPPGECLKEVQETQKSVHCSCPSCRKK